MSTLSHIIDWCRRQAERVFYTAIAVPVSLSMRPGVRYFDSLRWDILRSIIRKRDGYRCRECNGRGEWGISWLECHHIVRVADGGSYMPGNLRTLCNTCHSEAHE